MDIRDQWDKADTQIQRQIERVKTVIGLSVSCQIDWVTLYHDLQPYFKEEQLSQFVPHVSVVVRAWCEALVIKAEQESSEDWTDELLNKLGPAQTINLHIQVSCLNSTKPFTVGGFKELS